MMKKNQNFDTKLEEMPKANIQNNGFFIDTKLKISQQTDLKTLNLALGWFCSNSPIIKIKMSEQQNLSEFNRFLINNKDFLIDKYGEYFGSTLNVTIKTLSVQALIDYIYDIFSFNKYKNDPQVNLKIRNSLARNINDFIGENGERGDEPFISETAVEALTFCIQHNDMFSVQYDTEKSPKNRPTSKDAVGDFNVNVDFSNQNVQSGGSKHQRTSNGKKSVSKSGKSHKSLKRTGKESSNIRMSQIGEHQGNEQASNQDSSNGKSESQKRLKLHDNQFHQQRDPIDVNLGADVIKRNAKLAYLNFCKNQMELGGNKTFDRLSEQANTMTIGKMLVYAKAYNMFNDQITKQLLMSRFRKLSQGKRAIDFQKFYIMLTELHIVDTTLFDRLQLHDEHLHKKLKFVKFPFYTQDQNPRQYIVCRNFVNKLTAHSGKMHAQLKEEINNRRNEQKSPISNTSLLQRSYTKPIQREQGPRTKQKLLSPKDLSSGARAREYSIELSFIDKIVSPEDNDMKYLGEYQIEHYTKRYGNPEPAYISNSSSHHLKRKDSIVDNIRKRIQQIEHIENDSQRNAIRPPRARKYNNPY